MAKGIRYTEDDKRGWVKGFYAENPRISVAAYAKKIGIANKTFTDAKLKYQHEFETTASTSNDSHFNDFLNRKIENQEALYLQWLKDERERLLALVKDLEKQLDAAKPDR